METLYELTCEWHATCLPHKDGEVPQSAFPKGTTGELAFAACSSCCPFNAKSQPGKF